MYLTGTTEDSFLWSSSRWKFLHWIRFVCWKGDSTLAQSWIKLIINIVAFLPCVKSQQGHEGISITDGKGNILNVFRYTSGYFCTCRNCVALFARLEFVFVCVCFCMIVRFMWFRIFFFYSRILGYIYIHLYIHMCVCVFYVTVLLSYMFIFVLPCNIRGPVGLSDLFICEEFQIWHIIWPYISLSLCFHFKIHRFCIISICIIHTYYDYMLHVFTILQTWS